MELSALFEEFGASLGTDRLSFDADGQCALLFDGEHEVTFVHDGDDHSLIMHCEVGKLSAQADDICRELARSSLLGAGTGGAAFSIDDRLDAIVLWKRHDEDFDALPTLVRAVNAFLAQAIYWKDRLTRGDAPEGQAGPSSDVNIMNNFGMFV